MAAPAECTFVAICVVKVPVRIDQVLDRVGVKGGQRLSDLWARAGKPRINQQLPVGTRQDRDIPAGPQQNADVAAELLDRDGIR